MALTSTARGPRGGRRSSRPGAFVDINITPLTDVMMVLLVIFMITAQFISHSDQGLTLNLPAASHVEDLNSLGAIRVSVTQEGAIAVDGKLVAPADLEATLKAEARSPQQMVVVEVDSDSQNKYLVAVMDAALGAGLPNVVLATAPPATPATAPPLP
jgi:biopolymer transport protein ExbD